MGPQLLEEEVMVMEIRRMRFADVLGRSERSELSQLEAAELLGIGERTFRRWRNRLRDEGFPVWTIAIWRRRSGVHRWRRSSGCWT